MQDIKSPRVSDSGVAMDYAHDLSVALAALDASGVDSLLTQLTSVIQARRSLFICGNGGCAATASHVAHDLSAAALDMGHAPCRVQALSESPVRVTAIANDRAYEEIFTHQLAASAVPGDVLLVLSVSGDSPNVVAAARHARAAGLRVLAVVGRSSALSSLSDVAVIAGEADYGVTEDIQLAIGHMAVRLIRRVRRFTCDSQAPPAAPPPRILERSG